MKKLLRSSLFALLLFGCYAGITANATSVHLPQLPLPPANAHLPQLPLPPAR